MRLLSLLVSVLFVVTAQAKWEGPYKPAPAIVESLARKFDLDPATKVKALGGYTAECRIFSEKNKSVLGGYDEATGRPVLSAPTPNFWQWYFKCAREIVDKNVLNEKTTLTKLIGADGQALLTKNAGFTWAAASADEKLKMVLAMVDHLLWKETLADQGLDPQVYAKQIVSKVDGEDAKKKFKLRQAVSFASILVLTNQAFFLR